MNEENRAMDNTIVRENLTRNEAFEQFMGILREAIAAVTKGEAAEVDVERVVEGESTVNITIRREPFGSVVPRG